jgi:rod shape-determining protein MreC
MTALDRVVLLMTTPVRRLMSWAVIQTSQGARRFSDLRFAREANARLGQELFRAERENDRFQALAEENARLSKLLELKIRNPTHQFLQARVIGAGTSLLSQTLDVDSGSMDGVKRGMAVVSDQGLVGLVRRVAWTSSEVVLISDPHVSVQVAITRSRLRGRMEGSGLANAYRVRFVDVRRLDDIRVGDWVTTSGLGRLFPPGIPVGVVEGLDSEDVDEQVRQYRVLPSVDFSRLETVSIVLDMPDTNPAVITPDALRPISLRTPSSIATATASRGGVPIDVEKR